MRSRDIIDLYDRVHIGTHVQITLRKIHDFRSTGRTQLAGKIRLRTVPALSWNSFRAKSRNLRGISTDNHSRLSRALKIVRELVSRLIQLDVVRAGHDHHDDAAVFALLDRTSELRSFRPQLADRRIDVVAHQRDRVVTRVSRRICPPIRCELGARPTRSAPI